MESGSDYLTSFKSARGATMFASDHVTAKILFDERLREAEQKRQVRRVEASQRSGQTRFVEKLGDLLITIGTSLKTVHPKLA